MGKPGRNLRRGISGRIPKEILEGILEEIFKEIHVENTDAFLEETLKKSKAKSLKEQSVRINKTIPGEISAGI